MVSSRALSLSPVNSGGAPPAKEDTRSSSPIYTREGKEDVQGPAQTFRNQMGMNFLGHGNFRQLCVHILLFHQRDARADSGSGKEQGRAVHPWACFKSLRDQEGNRLDS